MAGLIFGLGVLALFFVLRSPLVDPSRIESVVDVPALGIVTMPRLGRRKFSGPVVVTGLAPLLREVSGPGVDRIELVSPPRADKARSRLALVLALALASSRRVRLHGSDRVLSKVPQGGFSGGGADGDLRSLGGPSPLQTTSPDKELDGVTVLDGVSLDKRLGSPPPPSTVTVLVLPEGYPEPGLRHFKRALTDNDLSGFVLVRRGVRRATELFPLAASPVPAARLRLGSRLRSRPQMDD